MVAGTKRQVAVSTERKYFQDAGLEKLAFPVKTDTYKDNVVLEEIALKVPDNNPFKKRKGFPFESTFLVRGSSSKSTLKLMINKNQLQVLHLLQVVLKVGKKQTGPLSHQDILFSN